MDELKLQRSLLKSRLTRFKTFFNKIEELNSIKGNELDNLADRLHEIKSIMNDYNSLHFKIVQISDDDLHESELDSFENAFFEVTSKASSFLKKFQQQKCEVADPKNSSSSHSNTSLPMPHIELPVFGGKFEDWLEFRDSFDSMVNKNPNLNNVQRFYYLRSALKGEAAQKIKTLQLTEENYLVAWETLTRKFENKKLAVNHNLKALFDLEPVKRDNYSQLQHFLDELTKIMHVLKQYEQPTIDTLLIHIISAKLTFIGRQEWESQVKKEYFPTFQEFVAFIDKRCELLGSLEANSKCNQNSSSSSNSNSFKSYNSKSHVGAIRLVCVFCKQGHSIFDCNSFQKLDVNKRIYEIRRLHLCLNCFKRNHVTKDCTAGSCRKCNKRHNTLLHVDYDSSRGTLQTDDISLRQNQVDISSNTLNPQAQSFQHQHSPSTNSLSHQASNISNSPSYNFQSDSQTLLSTASIEIADLHGNIHICRALLDPGSQINFIRNDLCNKLGLSKDRFKLTISGISNTQSDAHFRTKVSFKSRVNDFTATISCLVLDQITDRIPTKSFNLEQLNIPANIRLADSKPHITSHIDVLIGADIFWDLLCVGQHKLGKNKPVLQKTKLGWIIGGQIIQHNKTALSLACIQGLHDDKTQKQLQRFWEIEECQGNYNLYSPDEQYCEDHFIKTTIQDHSGRFTVNIPFKNNSTALGESRSLALRRFYSLERKLSANPSLKQEYSKFLSEYEALGHMTAIDESSLPKDVKHYLPHHAVTKVTSITTKTRVVFDGSAKTTSGLSLNDIQHCGPAIQNDLFEILLRFRKHLFVITADIEKMYRQVLIDPSQRATQLILWRANPTSNISCYQLNTITYGTASASFLAIRCLKQLALDNASTFPVASQIILNDFYVDDLLTGSNNTDDLIELQSHISFILKSAGFNLRKWSSNNKDLLERVRSTETTNDHTVIISNEQESRTLGILWVPTSDLLQYRIRNFTEFEKSTKRSVLATTAQIFDPLGLLGPVIIQAKMLLQSLWQEKLTWDESLPMHLHTKWLKFRDQLSCLNSLKIPRHVIIANARNIELHGFSDASEAAYGACIYIKSCNLQGQTFIHLLCAKSRVAPLKNLSLPRLELSAALLLARLVKQVTAALNLSLDNIFYWCDSTITLNWLQATPNRWKTFVANRVAEIQQLTNIHHWRHVRSRDNPADLLSRGVTAFKLQTLPFWWHGPDWLKGNGDTWPTQPSLETSTLEARVLSHLVTDNRSTESFSRFSSLKTLQAVVAYVYRFIHNTRNKQEDRVAGPLSATERDKALINLIKIAQFETFCKEIKYLSKGKPLHSKSSLLTLNAFLDEDGVLRVGGRLRLSNFSRNKKHPIVLFPSHWLTKLICRTEHIRLLHCGVNQLLSSLRDKYWPLAVKGILRKIIHQCTICFRANPKSFNPLMGDLPKKRITPAPPFYNCGVDYAGPILIKNKKGRGSKLIKAYICIFVCCATKAIHLDLVTDLTTEAFLATLKRFTARRGQSLNIYSDNGTNFKGAKSELLKFLSDAKHQNAMINYCDSVSTSWHFIPPRSPHFGGQWEAGVKSVKSHLKRVTLNTSFTFEEFYTLLTRIEAILNSRPLTSLSSDPNDPDPLTPAHFLIGRKLTALPEFDYSNAEDNRLSKYQQIQKIQQHFWKRWSKEYIHELQARSKWKTNFKNILQPGVLVVIKEDNLPPLKWSLGRVIQLHPGSDGIIRVVTVKTANGVTLKRAVSKICAFPIEDDSVSV